MDQANFLSKINSIRGNNNWNYYIKDHYLAIDYKISLSGPKKGPWESQLIMLVKKLSQNGEPFNKMFRRTDHNTMVLTPGLIHRIQRI
jgi:hypothetical protein